MSELNCSDGPLQTGAESNVGDRVWGEVEKSSFIALPGKGDHNMCVCVCVCVCACVCVCV